MSEYLFFMWNNDLHHSMGIMSVTKVVVAVFNC